MNPPDQSPDDVRLARVLYPFVEQRVCHYMDDDGQWEEWDDHRKAMCYNPALGPVREWQDRPGVLTHGDALLWCCRATRRDSWRPVPAYGEDEAAAFRALDWYCERKRLYSQIDYVPPEGDMPAERYVILQRLGGRDRIVAEGSTFPLAARAAILAFEEVQDGR